MTVRVRYAPSPTGYLHVGGARTALYNWLFARHHGGTFILRSDDTDQERSTPEYYEDILDALGWLGIDWDEGIEVGGPHAPYRQSLRLDRYRAVAEQLVAEGKAYYSFATPEQLDDFRTDARSRGRAPAYDGRFDPDPEEGKQRVAAGEQASIRFAVPRPASTVLRDVVRGEVTFGHEQVEDFVILRSNGYPTYHLASTVDDVDFGITHVIRGEDLLSSTPKHILLTQAMGSVPPTYAHLSLLMGPDGKKLSKRHGHTAVGAYRAAGFLPSAMVNYLALLGWSPGDDDTIISLGGMIERFELESVSKNPAIFDTAKLEWMNGVYLREVPPDEFLALARDRVEADLGRSLDPGETEQLAAIAPLVQERAKLLAEIPEQVRFLYVDELSYDEQSWEKIMLKPEAAAAVAGAAERLAGIDEWSTPAIEEALRSLLDDLELSARKGFQPLRVAATGSSVSPPLFESLEALGRQRTLQRLEAAHSRL
ncbi:MAG: glutamate--tRNA ligase [Acidimicrobiia bacterium]|nr:glutamate--tRNA ligase [Acidimicrobiia bacterium]